jgi:hypothetical protein
MAIHMTKYGVAIWFEMSILGLSNYKIIVIGTIMSYNFFGYRVEKEQLYDHWSA